MLLAVDIGNTDTVVGVYEGERLRDQFRVASQHHLTSDEAGFFITGLLDRMQVPNEKIDNVVIGSVVPPLTSVYEETSRKYFGCSPLIVSAHIKLPIRIEIDQPDEVGADRIANSVAAYHKFGGPVIVVDFGTATTFDIVSPDGAYIGGVIIPGPATSMAELARKAARLFEIRIEKPDSVVGKSTAGALKSGLFYGKVGQTDFIVKKIIEETGFTTSQVIATGGWATGIEKASETIKLIEPSLTLDGLRLISEQN
ncbi:MAG: type III pantothenate kinase [Candidatus Zixiibacteriota bacterium]|nr:MAG: type III pantothenate kinase [candidate division Zixibacteria bacterium]